MHFKLAQFCLSSVQTNLPFFLILMKDVSCAYKDPVSNKIYTENAMDFGLNFHVELVVSDISDIRIGPMLKG